MRVIKVTCDKCGKEIPTKVKKDIFGIEREFLQTGSVSVCENPYPLNEYLDLCKECALEISLELTNFVHKTLIGKSSNEWMVNRFYKQERKIL